MSVINYSNKTVKLSHSIYCGNSISERMCILFGQRILPKNQLGGIISGGFCPYTAEDIRKHFKCLIVYTYMWEKQQSLPWHVKFNQCHFIVPDSRSEIGVSENRHICSNCSQNKQKQNV